MKFHISKHARDKMHQREIPLRVIKQVLKHPQQILDSFNGKMVFQSQIDFGGGKVFLVRVIVVLEARVAQVVTVYKTSKIEKYWSRT